MECEADAICDGTDAFVPTVMQHVEYAGVHSGDSAAMIPPQGISPEHLALIEDYTKRIAVELGVVGLMNIQYAIGDDGVVYVLEANPRASRTVPLVSKVCNLNMAGLATRVMLGASISELGLVHRLQEAGLIEQRATLLGVILVEFVGAAPSPVRLGDKGVHAQLGTVFLRHPGVRCGNQLVAVGAEGDGLADKQTERRSHNAG